MASKVNFCILQCIPSNAIQKQFAWNKYLTELKCGGGT